MSSRFCLFAGILVALAAPAAAVAQEEESPPLRIEWVRAGFQPYAAADGFPRFKVGMWTPVYVRLVAGSKGYPEGGDALPKVQLETSDSEDVGTIYTVDVGKLSPREARTIIGYTRTGNLSSEIKVSVVLAGRTILTESAHARAPDLGSLLVVSLGGNVEGLAEAMDMLNAMNAKEPGGEFDLSKFAGYEAQADALPDLSFGYDAVDLLVLCTGNKKFLTDLRSDRARVAALAQYVRRGGRLVIPVAWQHQDILHGILTSPAWQPALPVVPPADAGEIESRRLDRALQVETWGQVERKPFPPAGRTIFARLDPENVPPGFWDVLAKHPEGNVPLIARVPYGLGQVTLLAFPFDEAPFMNWEGRRDFLRGMIHRLTPREATARRDRGEGWHNDVAAELQRSMDQFDVQVVPFGLVALFIILYILVVGPLDYFVLKYVFKKLEWTWFTFPAVVLVVSAAAYYTAYALKGKDQKVNQVDIIDFDLKTDLDASFAPRKAYVYGESFFTVLSPRIQAYTIGVDPNPAFLAGDRPFAAARPVTWLGRPDPEAWGMGRRGSQGLFRKPYLYAPDAEGLERVPIAVWTTKSFRASWEAALPSLPFDATLRYHQDNAGKILKITGAFKNNLPADLADVWFIVPERCYGLDQAMIPAGKSVDISLSEGVDINAWVNVGAAGGVAADRPSGMRSAAQVVKGALFEDKTGFGVKRNHLLRRLDQSWRLEARPPRFELDPSVRDVIVFARLSDRHGRASELAGDKSRPLPTRLWLGALPAPDAAPPETPGAMTHETYIRILLPLVPADKNP